MRESTRHRVAFNAYVALGAARSIEGLHRMLSSDPRSAGLQRTPGLRTLYRWSTELHWQERIADLEREARVRDAEAQLEALREMNARHVREGLALQQKAIARFQSASPHELKPGDAIRALTEGVRLERLARGDVTNRTAIEGTDHYDLSGFSLAELRSLAAAASQSTGGDRPSQPRQPGRLDGGVSHDPAAADGGASSDPGDS